jgi:hypothetical protein
MGGERVDLLAAVRIVDEHLTSALCETVFARVRTKERRRLLTLDVMAEFWVAVILRAPASLRQALDEAHRDAGRYPLIPASPESFFERAQTLRAAFFEGVFDAFLESALPDCGPSFESALQAQFSDFSTVLVVDGSRCDAVARRLKVTWDEESVVLPGSLLVLYDLFRGVPRRVRFDADAAAAEVPALKSELDHVPEGALLLADRAFCSHRLFGDLEARGIRAVVRCTQAISLAPGAVLGCAGHEGGKVRDVLVTAGDRRRPREQRKLRLIEWKTGRGKLRLLTNVLDPRQLPAAAAIALYQRRWSVERMFYDLKEVLNLHRFYAANANAVGMQVYAAAIVYVALRIAQAEIARAAGLPPERLSVEKLFPKVAAAAAEWAPTCRAALRIRAANPGVKIVEPDWSQEPFAWTTLDTILVEPRRTRRRPPPRAPARASYVSLHRCPRPARPQT